MARQGYGSGRRGQGSGRGYGDDQDRWDPESQVGRDYDDRGGPSGRGYDDYRGGRNDRGQDVGFGRSYRERSRRGGSSGRRGSYSDERFDSDQDRDDVLYTGRQSYADVSEDRDAQRRSEGRRSGRYDDDHYHELRERHMEQFDRDYDEYRRDRRERMGQDFDEWRRERGSSDDSQSSGGSSGSTSSAATSGSTSSSGKTDKS